MKKFLTIALALALTTLCLASCSKDTDFFIYSDHDVVADGYIALADYKGIDIDPLTIDDAELNTKTLQLASDESTDDTGITDRAVADGDIVNIDYVGKIDGEEFEGGAAEDSDLIIGSDMMIDGFEDGIIGISPEETKTITVTFPAEYHSEELAGKEATFDITVNKIYDPIIKETARVSLLAEKQLAYNANSDDVLRATAWATLRENFEVTKYPDGLLEKVTKVKVDNLTYQYCNMFGVLDISALEQIGITKEYLNEMAKADAETVLEDELIIYAIAQAEGMTVSEEEYNAKVSEIAELASTADAPITDEQVKKTYSRQSIETRVYQDKVLDFVVSNMAKTAE